MKKVVHLLTKTVFISFAMVLALSSIYVKAQTVIFNSDNNNGNSYATLAPTLVNGVTASITCTENWQTFAGTITDVSSFTSNSNAGNALAMNNSSGANARYWTFALGGSELASYKSYKLYVQAQRNNAGAKTLTLAYSTDGSNYTNCASSMAISNNGFSEKVFDLSAITNLNNKAAVYFKLMASGANGTGTLSIDNIEIQAIYNTPPLVNGSDDSHSNNDSDDNDNDGNGHVWKTNGNTGTNPATNFIGTSDNAAIVIKSNNAEAMRIATDGKVGIGITPTEKLEVNGNLKVSGNIIANNIHVTRHTTIDTIRSNEIIVSRIISPDSLIHFGDSSVTIDPYYNRIWAAQSHPHGGFAANKGISLGSKLADGIETGSVAIGTYSYARGVYSYTMGTYVRSMVGGAMVIGSGFLHTTPVYLENNTPNSLAIGFNSSAPTLFVSSSNGGATTGKIGIGGITVPLAKLHLKSDGNSLQSFALKIDNSASQPLYYVRDDGYVGIGTASPIQALDVNGKIHVSGGVIQKGGTPVGGTTDLGLYSLDGSWMRFVTSNKPILFYSDANSSNGIGGSPNVTINANGNVDIKGAISIDQQSANSGTFANLLTFGASGSGEGIGSDRINNTTKNGLDFYTKYTQRMKIDNDGNVGIGTNAPEGSLQIGNHTTGDALKIGKSGYRHHITSNRDIVFNAFDLDASVENSPLFSFRKNAAKFIEDDSPALMAIDDKGNMNIWGALIIDRQNANTGSLAINSLNFGGSGEGIGSDRVNSATLNGLDFYTNNTKQMTIDNAGAVKISTLGGNGDVYVKVDDDGKLTTVSAADAGIGLWSKNTTDVWRPTGNVGIGSEDTHGKKLYVTGNVGIEGTLKAIDVWVVPDPWADYVFAKDYKLTSLKEVESFIQKNQHLPDIPSQKEVKENGLSLGTMDGLLLKKVEELTLYVIELNKTTQTLSDKLITLEQENENLKKALLDGKK